MSEGNTDAPLVLVIEDEPRMLRFLRPALEGHGYRVIESATGKDGLTQASTRTPDLVLLDLGLPDLDGLEVTRRLREWSQIPIVVISARGREDDKVAALDAGADDYVTKPFGAGELLARIRAALRRAGRTENGAAFVVGDLTVDMARRLVQIGPDRVQLTPTEYDLLRVLVQHSGKALTHRQLMREVWGGMCYEDSLHLVRVNVSNLRHKLEADPAHPRYILTEPGVGYRMATASWLKGS